VLVVGRSYHGGTRFTLKLSDSAAFHLPMVDDHPDQPRVPPAYCYRCPWNLKYPTCGIACAEAIDAKVANDSTITGLLLEPVIGSGGVIVPPTEYFAAVQEICERRGLALILDEVMTGCGRTGTFLATEQLGLKPDAIALAKALGGGYVPIGATLLNRELAEGLRKYEDVSATMAWMPLACAVALVNLKLIQEENLPERARTMGEKMLADVRELCERCLLDHVGEVRGIGLMIGIELVNDQVLKTPATSLIKRIILHAWRGGLMIGSSWDWTTIILMPPLVIEDAMLANGLTILADAFRKATRSMGT